MRVRVLREACCAQDDQLGPLEVDYDIPASATFGELVALVQESRFLQFSASHVTLQGEVAGVPVVRIRSPFCSCSRPAEFDACPSQMAAAVVGPNPLQFRFLFG